MIKLELPIYYKYKTKGKNRNVLVSMNFIRNSHYHLKSKIKKHYHDLIKKELYFLSDDKIEKYRVKYNLYYKNPSSDMMNVVSMIDKYLNDAIQEIGLTQNDNVKFYKKCFIEVANQDKDNPRIEIIIEELS